MENVLERLVILVISLYWGSIWILMALINVIRFGPKKVWDSKDPANPPQELFDPVYGEHTYINLGTVRLHYVISGPRDAPLMLMLHGFPEIWYSWRYQIKEFQKDFRVVAVDMRGFGDSDKPKGVENYKMDLLVEDVRTFIEALGYKSCILVSHDWGGGVAYAFSAAYPEMVERLVVMNIPPAPIWRKGFTTWTRPRQFLSSSYIYVFFLPFLPEFLTSLKDYNFIQVCFSSSLFGVKSGLMTNEIVECYKYYFRKRGALTSGMNYYRANLHVPPVCHKLNYTMPVKIIWGCKDMAITLSLLEDTVKAIPQADVTRIQEASHWVQMDQPDKVNNSIREFLEKTKYPAEKK